MTEPIKRRRWFRFSLRMLFVVVTLLCVWLGFKVNAARRQKLAVKTIVDAGGSVLFDYQDDPKAQIKVGRRPGTRDNVCNFTLFVPDLNALAPGPTWLRKQFGDDHFRNVIQVVLPFFKLKDPRDAIDQLANLPSLKCLILNDQGPDSKLNDSDLAALGKLSHLERLMIRHCHITGEFISRLQNPDRLVQLDISETDVADDAMQQLGRMTNLESVILSGTRITDAGIVHLHKLAKLKVLLLSQTKVTQTGISELQKTLPNTIIFGR